jgi:hypothetical protein
VRHASHAAFMTRFLKPTTAMFDIVHPEQYRRKVQRLRNGFSSLFNSYMFDFGSGWSYVWATGVLGGTVLRISPADKK